MSENSENIQVARISAIQAIAVALIAAVAGAATTYMTVNNDSDEVDALRKNFTNMEKALVQKDAELDNLKTNLQNTSLELKTIKQRVRDILGPKEDELRSMSRSLERMRNDPGIDQFHRERLEEVARRLDKIDSKVLEIVQ